MRPDGTTPGPVWLRRSLYVERHIDMKYWSNLAATFLVILYIAGCGPIDSGFLNTGGTDDPRKLIGIAYSRIYESDRIIGGRNVLRRSIEQAKKRNDTYALAVSYNMMGFTYIQEEKDPNKAKPYYDKAIEIINKNQFDCELIHYYIGMALSEKLLGIIENSCSYEEKAKKTLVQVKHNFQNQIHVYEGGQKAINIAEIRVKELSSHLKCIE